tara:strand:- start:77 stop:298 length:222 start_codon:yes stop_codon:yes gene_type:complete
MNMTYALKDLERYRRQERKRQRIILKAQKDMQDFKDKVYWEDALEGFLKGAIFTVAFLSLCCTLGYVFAKLTL